MFAEASTTLLTSSAASATSAKVKSLPPTTLSMTPCAPSIVVSKRGQFTATLTASIILLSPLATPTPRCAIPLSFNIVLTSAKSRLINAGLTISSASPFMPCFKISSATRNASTIVVFLSTTVLILSLGITMSVSTYFLRLSNPFTVFSILFLPSNANGSVTTATVRIFKSRAIFAITGAAPVPVPPPIPAVINKRSVPLIISVRISLLSSAAALPTSGSAPAPSPLVNCVPICILFSQGESARICESVLTTTYSAQLIRASIILLMALLPAPPTPMTFILALPEILLFIAESLNINSSSEIVKIIALHCRRARRIAN